MALGGRGYTIIAVAWLFLALSTISIALRCYVRLRLVKNFGIDDTFAVIAWALFMVNISFVVTAAYHGSGQHIVDLPLEEIPQGLMWWWLCEPVFVVASMAMKFSIGIYLIRIAQTTVHKAVLWTTIAIMESFSFAFFFVFVLQCVPSSYFWTQVDGGTGSCMNLNSLVNVTYAYSAIACATDWLYAIMPIFLLWNLEMNIRTKISVGVLIAIGASASIATVIRIPYLKGFHDKADFLYSTTDVAIWTTVELGLGLVAASLATLRPLFRVLMGDKSTAVKSTKTTGDTSSHMSWVKPSPKNGGYIRSESDNVVEYEMRHKIGAASYVKTDVESQRYFEREIAEDDTPQSPSIPTASVNHPYGWNTVECQIKDEEEHRERVLREHGIVKSTKSTFESRFSR